ncbi:hypothetical protein SAMN02745664_1382 [Moraxella cuniculi DSM 21768]|uniref:Uncharacterized protein n=1 Tax=Moraxella cuniculi DSM 21768 TaxID=1122245 RepID=A0A1N7GCQ6_9GAMM|nr:hypothetical protein [Moraxella cuniculi]OOS07813.1 hypothetical protein B0189_02035 [Moraxella cuniculi]SIS10373.1 hypothetical protein SAMN02745664_1382 [Moraxella cuniculi DSM 21768]
MNSLNFIEKYKSLKNDDDKIDFLSCFFEGKLNINLDIYNLLIEELDNHQVLDEFLVVKIIKVLSRFYNDFSDTTRDIIFNVFLTTEEDLVQQHSLLELEFKQFSKEQIEILKEKINDADEDLQPIIESILERQ